MCEMYSVCIMNLDVVSFTTRLHLGETSALGAQKSRLSLARFTSRTRNSLTHHFNRRLYSRHSQILNFVYLESKS